MARRESKEAESKVESPVTPQRRTTRSRSKNDDNVSVTSEDSVRSTRSKASEKERTGRKASEKERKGRKAAAGVKPELSAIPELAAGEREDGGDRSGERRLSRQQRSLLSSLQLRPRGGRRPGAGPGVGPGVGPGAGPGAAEQEDEDREPFDVQPIDRISLLNKTDFEGPADRSEPARLSPEPDVVSHSSGRRTPRMARAASESKTVPKAAKIGRRVSVDVAAGAESPGAGSAARAGRRASFTRACEALHTPKGRRASADLRKETDSGGGSPGGAEAPARRPRRGSAQSDTSVSTDPGKRSKKLSTVEESDAKI